MYVYNINIYVSWMIRDQSFCVEYRQSWTIDLDIHEGTFKFEGQCLISKLL